MVPIRIQCGCGQLYEFEIEPVDGRMPGPVACPTCGLDGTEAANASIAQTMAAQEPAPAAPPAGPLRIAAHAPAAAATRAPVVSAPRAPVTAGRHVPKLPGQIDRTQAEHEARAKILWGDPPKEVLKYLMGQGFPYQEALETVNEMYAERKATIRGNGIKNVVIGSLLICVPIGTWISFMHMGVIYVRTFGFTVVIGIIGFWRLVKGIFMLAAPGAAEGDASAE
jgi:hypothetical protein